MWRLWIVAMTGGLMLGCQPKKKTSMSLEKGNVEYGNGSLKVSTEASMRLADLFGMANHHFLPLNRVSGLRYRVTGSADYIKRIEETLAKRSYALVTRRESWSTDSSNVTLYCSLTLLSMTESNQKDWLAMVEEYQMVEESSEKTLQSSVVEEQKINYLKKLAQNPNIKWDESEVATASEERSSSTLFFAKESVPSIR